jgi:hypothetical protein
MKIERKYPIKFLNLFIIVYFISSSGIILFFSSFELSFAQQEVTKNNRDIIKINYYNDWEYNNDKTISTTNSENTKPFNKKVTDDNVIQSFSHFHLLHMIPDMKENRYGLSLFGNTIIPITLYPNMSSLEDARVYHNMSSLGHDRVYQNMTSLEQDRVYQNMSSLAP